MEVLDKVKYNYDLLCEIVRPVNKQQKLKVDLTKIEDIILKKIPDTVKDNAPDDFYVLYKDFRNVYERFKDFILFDKLIGKNIIALGGGFSTGKSSFLNALMGHNALPEDINPSTSVPTYIVKGKEHNVMGINVFDSMVNMEVKDIRKIAHGFGAVQDDEDEDVAKAVTLGHLLKCVFFSTPWQKYDNIAFLDTPGYSKPDSEQYSAKTDANIARGQLNSSNYILWFVQAGAGTITEEDIKFIKTLREDIPKLIIVNKAERKLKDVKAIIEQVKRTLTMNGIRFVDVLAFSCKKEQVAGEVRKFLDDEQVKIEKQIKEWNKQIYESNFAVNFKELFIRCKDFYDNDINEESKKLTRLKESLVRLSVNAQEEDVQPIHRVVGEIEGKIGALKNIKKNLQQVQTEFFTEIKRIADGVGIAMPEPSEIDLLGSKIQNPLQLLSEYKKAKKIKSDSKLLDMFQDAFADMKPVMNRMPGGDLYREDLLDTMKKEFVMDSAQIRL